MTRISIALLAVCFATFADGAVDWRTPAEKSRYTQTPRYAETRAYFERLDAASERGKLIDFGTSPEGRKQFAMVIASDSEFTPAAARASKKPVLLIQACIHPGENEGKDSLMALSREWLIEGKQRAALDKVILLLIPILSVDGHERFSPYARINQNGPAAMGWRSTAHNLNLNRDFIKTDAPEMRAWLKLWQAWNPSLLVDMHNTNGADYQYDLLLDYASGAQVHPAIDAWQKQVWRDQVLPKTQAAGFLLGPYFSMRESDNIAAGLNAPVFTPRFSTGFGPAVNRPALLLETHMLKSFKQRTLVNNALLRNLLTSIGTAPQALQTAVREADQAGAARRAGDSVTLSYKLGERSENWAFKAYASTRTLSEVSGALWTRYDNRKPITINVDWHSEVLEADRVSAPAGYLVPRYWTRAISKLKQHGINTQRLEQDYTLRDAQSYRFANVSYGTQPFEGRVRPQSFEATPSVEVIDYPAGSVFVPIAQARSLLAMHLLEPIAPDSLVRNGDADWLMTRTEYAEPRVLEGKAREMLRKDPKLLAAFQAKLKEPAFAGSAAARLNFFYEKLPHYDVRFMRYPVARVTAEQLEALQPALQAAD
jgi:hypothetical protein